MYMVNKPVAALRTKMRQEFERHRYVKQLSVIDMLLFQSHAEFQVWHALCCAGKTARRAYTLLSATVQETMNYWKQVPHLMKYFRADENPSSKIPNNFMTGFLEVSRSRGTREVVSDST